MISVSLEVMVLLFAAILGSLLARRFGQSIILGEILIGVLIGPTVLGLVHYDESIKVLAELGAIFMLFTVGLECNYRDIYNVKNGAVAFFGVLVPFLLGWWVAVLFGFPSLESLFLATALTATSIAITAKILEDRGLLSSPVAKTIIGAAVIDDVLGLILLSVVTNLDNLHPFAIALHVGIATLFVIACILLIKPVNQLMTRIDRWARIERHHQLTLFAAMVVAFGYAGIAAIVGLSSIIGAFLAGVTLEGSQIRSFHEGAVYFEILFSAIFFVALGVAADFRSLGGAWIFAIVFILVAVISKILGCALPAKLAGHTWKDSLAIGLGMVPRGEVAMIVGLLGLTAGIIQASTYAIIILMAFVTTIVTPLLLLRTLRKNSHRKPL